MTLPEIAQRAAELERKICSLREETENLPVHAPKRILSRARLEELEREYALVMRDLNDAQGQKTLFEEVET